MNKLVISLLASCVTFTGFARVNADSAAFYFSKARLLSEAHKVWEADKSYEKAVGFDPFNNEVRLNYASFLLEQHKYHPALLQYENILAADKNDVEALTKITTLHFKLRRWNDVLTYSARLNPATNNADVKFMIGKAHYSLENFGQAQQFLSQAIKLDPKMTEAVVLMGKIYIELENYKQAVEVYNTAIKLDPDNKQVLYELGMLHFTLNNKKEAVKYFELAAEKGFKTDLIYYENLGMAYLNFNVPKGIEALNKVLEKKPGNAEILFQIAQGYYGIKNYQDAAATYQKVFETNPNNSKALYMAGVAYIKAGDKGKGEAFCEQAIKMDPNLTKYREEVPSQ